MQLSSQPAMPRACAPASTSPPHVLPQHIVLARHKPVLARRHPGPGVAAQPGLRSAGGRMHRCTGGRMQGRLERCRLASAGQSAGAQQASRRSAQRSVQHNSTQQSSAAQGSAAAAHLRDALGAAAVGPPLMQFKVVHLRRCGWVGGEEDEKRARHESTHDRSVQRGRAGPPLCSSQQRRAAPSRSIARRAHRRQVGEDVSQQDARVRRLHLSLAGEPARHALGRLVHVVLLAGGREAPGEAAVGWPGLAARHDAQSGSSAGPRAAPAPHCTAAPPSPPGKTRSCGWAWGWPAAAARAPPST